MITRRGTWVTLLIIFLISTVTIDALPSISTTSLSNQKLTLFSTIKCTDTTLTSCIDVASIVFKTTNQINPTSQLKLTSVELFTCLPPDSQGEAIEWVVPNNFVFNKEDNDLSYTFRSTDSTEKTPFTSSLDFITTILTNHDPTSSTRKYWNPKSTWDSSTNLITTLEITVNGLDTQGQTTTSIISIPIPIWTSNTPIFNGSNYTSIHAQNRDNSVIVDGANKKVEYEWSINGVVRNNHIDTTTPYPILTSFTHMRLQSIGPLGFNFSPARTNTHTTSSDQRAVIDTNTLIQINDEFHPFTIIDQFTIDIMIQGDTKKSLLSSLQSVSFSLSHPVFKLNSNPDQLKCLSHRGDSGEMIQPPSMIRFSLFSKGTSDQISLEWNSPVTYQSSYAILPRQILSYAFFEPYNNGLYMTRHVLNFDQGRNALNRVDGLNFISYPYSPDVYDNLDKVSAIYDTESTQYNALYDHLPGRDYSIGNDTQRIIVESYSSTVRTYYNGPYSATQISKFPDDNDMNLQRHFDDNLIPFTRPAEVESSTILSHFYFNEKVNAANSICFFGQTVNTESEWMDSFHDNTSQLDIPQSLHLFKFNLTADQIYKVAENTRQYLPNVVLETYGNVYTHVWHHDHNFLFLNFSSTAKPTAQQPTPKPSYFYSQVPIHRFLPLSTFQLVVQSHDSLYFNSTYNSNPDKPNYYPSSPQKLTRVQTSSFTTLLSTFQETFSSLLPSSSSQLLHPSTQSTHSIIDERFVEDDATRKIKAVRFQVMGWRWAEEFMPTPDSSGITHHNYLHLSLPFFDSYFLLHYPWWDVDGLNAEWGKETICLLKYGSKKLKLTYENITPQIYLDIGTPNPPKIEPIFDIQTGIPLSPVKQIRLEIPQWMSDYMTKKQHKDLDLQCDRIDIAVLKDNTDLIDYPTRIHPYSIPNDNKKDVLSNNYANNDNHVVDDDIQYPIAQCFNTFAQTGSAYLSIQLSRHTIYPNDTNNAMSYVESWHPAQSTTSFDLSSNRLQSEILLWVSYGVFGIFLIIYISLFIPTLIAIKRNNDDAEIPAYALSRHHVSNGYGSIHPEQELAQSESTVGSIVTVKSNVDFPAIIGTTSPNLGRRTSNSGFDRRNSTSLDRTSGGQSVLAIGSQPLPSIMSQHRQGSNKNVLSPTIIKTTSISSRQPTPSLQPSQQTSQPSSPAPFTPNLNQQGMTSTPVIISPHTNHNENSDESTSHANIYVDLDDAFPHAHRSSLSIGPHSIHSRAGIPYTAATSSLTSQQDDGHDRLSALLPSQHHDHDGYGGVDQPSYGD